MAGLYPDKILVEVSRFEESYFELFKLSVHKSFQIIGF